MSTRTYRASWGTGLTLLAAAWGVACSSQAPSEGSDSLERLGQAVFLAEGGQVVLEAENFDTNTSQGGKTWSLESEAAASLGQVMHVTPDTGTNNNLGYVSSSPRLDFQVDFAQAGTYQVWVRGRAGGSDPGNSDSCHVGLDGAPSSTADRLSSFSTSFGWSRSTMDGAVATLNVPSPGVHTVNVWMREDGFILDKLMLTTDSGFTPSGLGPNESPTAGGNDACLAATYEAENMGSTTGGSVSGGWNIWSNGSLYATHSFASGQATLTVRAQGQAAAGAWPHMIVRVGGVAIGDVIVQSSSWTDYSFPFDASAGPQEIRIEFDNDYYDEGSSEDRNLLVDRVLVSCETTEEPTCTDGIRNGTESDVDCGGGCDDCPLGSTCSGAADCTSGNCISGICQSGGGTPYLDPALPVADRVADLLARMTLEEKIGQMTQGEQESVGPDEAADLFLGSVLSGADSWPGDHAASDWIDLVNGFQDAALGTRLGIPILYGVDAVHGHAKVMGGTIFPHNIALGATRNPGLAYQSGVITAKEMMASGIPWTFAPALSVARDQRWGRTYEGFGEDPAIVSMMTTVISGIQGDDLSHPDTALATAKHFVGDGGAMWNTGDNPEGGPIDRGDAQMSEAALRAIHLSPYLEAVALGVGTVMASFSSFNGDKMHGSQYLLTDVLKGELGFEGFVVSDWLAIEELPGSFPEQVRNSVNAGVDMFMMPNRHVDFINTLLSEVNSGGVSQARIDDAVSRILQKKFELGLFENPRVNVAATGEIGSEAHRDVARQIVRESLVLLKNDNDILPLAPTDTVCLSGSGADDMAAQVGAWTLGWQGPNALPIGETIREGFEQVGTVVSSGCDVGVRVVVESNSPHPYAEWRGDNADPRHDNSGSCQGARGCIVVLLGGRPMNIESFLSGAGTMGVVMAWYPGSEGRGIAEVFYGVSGADFVGRLPVTWNVDAVDSPVNYCDPAIPPSCDDTGDHYSDPSSPPPEVLFPIGYGLSYGATASCTDGTENGSETDTDCGGTCPACDVGQSCDVASDCGSGVCNAGICEDVSALPSAVWLEAEAGVLGGSPGFAIQSAPQASGGAAISPTSNNLGMPGPNRASYTVELAAGTYVLWGRTIAPSLDDDSFWISVDGAPFIRWNDIPQSNSWAWDDVHDSDGGGATMTFTLSEGTHTIVVANRENGVFLDMLYLTSNGDIPTGLGGGENCFDGLVNQNETDVDCGGDCGACDLGLSCNVDSDCQSTFCTSGICEQPPASCTDGTQNGDETDVDCGGPDCDPCPEFPAAIWLEAEAGALSGSPTFNVVANASASGGQALSPTSNNQNSPGPNRVTFSFEVASGNYVLWGRVIAPSLDDDSFWVSMDGGNFVRWNTIAQSSSWVWDDVHDSDAGGGAVSYVLSEGSHTLVIANREDGATLDQLYLTSLGDSP